MSKIPDTFLAHASGEINYAHRIRELEALNKALMLALEQLSIYVAAREPDEQAKKLISQAMTALGIRK